MNLITVKEKISEGKNVILYNKDVYKCFSTLNNEFLSIYFNEPVPVKPILVSMIKRISGRDDRSLDRLTISELKKIFVKELEYDNIIIFFNHFERLTKSSVQTYQYLNSLDNVQFVCSFDKKFKSSVYPFFKTFILLNEEEYNLMSGKDEINITYPVYLLLAIFAFFIYLKTASMIHNGYLLIGGAWFALIIFRTLIYAGGRT